MNDHITGDSKMTKTCPQEASLVRGEDNLQIYTVQDIILEGEKTRQSYTDSEKGGNAFTQLI